MPGALDGIVPPDKAKPINPVILPEAVNLKSILGVVAPEVTGIGVPAVALHPWHMTPLYSCSMYVDLTGVCHRIVRARRKQRGGVLPINISCPSIGPPYGRDYVVAERVETHEHLRESTEIHLEASLFQICCLR